MKTNITDKDKYEWAHSPIVKRVKQGDEVEETLANGKTYVLKKVAEQRYQLVGIK